MGILPDPFVKDPSVQRNLDALARRIQQIEVGIGIAPGPEGPPGPDGATGPPGPAGADGVPETFVYTQSLPATTWTITHGLSRYPSVTIVDSAGSTIDADVTYPDADTVLVTFTGATSGNAYLN